MTRFELPDVRVPEGVKGETAPDLLKYWYLGTKARRWIFLRRFREVDIEIGPDKSCPILDIGSAWGYNMVALGLLGYRVFGLDLVTDPFQAGMAISSENGVDFMVVGADAARMPFESKRFSAITMVETFEHVFEADRELVLSECYRVLREGGRLVISTPNYDGAVERLKRFAVRHRWLIRMLPAMRYPSGPVSRYDYHPYRYHRPYRVREIGELLSSVGFRLRKEKLFLFTFKNTPNRLYYLSILAERVLERLPLIRRLAATACIVAEKASG